MIKTNKLCDSKTHRAKTQNGNNYSKNQQEKGGKRT